MVWNCENVDTDGLLDGCTCPVWWNVDWEIKLWGNIIFPFIVLFSSCVTFCTEFNIGCTESNCMNKNNKPMPSQLKITKT